MLASGFVALLAIALAGGLLLSAHQRVQHLAASHQTTLTLDQQNFGTLNYGIRALTDRWYGVPRLFQAPPIANTDFVYFDVTGTSQAEIENSFKRADICKTYGPCLVDPAVPNGVFLGLEGDESTATYCYSPRTTTVVFRHRIILPRWSPPQDGSIRRTLVEKWNDLLQVIYIHEAGHAAIAAEDIAALNAQAQALPSCQAWANFWNNPHLYDKLDADQNAYHARLRADCRPEIGCIPAYWEGWIF